MIDQFVLAKLEEKGMIPAGDASKETLLRRALPTTCTGLPIEPSPQEVKEFVADTSPQAFAKVIDRLLTSARLRRSAGAVIGWIPGAPEFRHHRR